MFYVKILLVFVWLAIVSLVMALAALLRPLGVEPNHIGTWLFGHGCMALLGIRLQVEGKENLYSRRPCIYVGNHQSAVDAIIYAGIYPRGTVVVGKKELLFLPFFGLAFLAGGNVFLHRQRNVKAVSQLNRVVEAVRRRGVSVLIFPEGTRRGGFGTHGLLPFKKGPFHMAIDAQIPIVPIVASDLSGVASWKDRKIRGGVVRFSVLPPVDVAGYTKDDLEQLIADVRSRMEAEVGRLALRSGS